MYLATKHNKLDDRILAAALAEGKTNAEAYDKAVIRYNNKDITEKTKTEVVSEKLSNNPNIKKDIISQLEDKRQKVLDAMTSEKAEAQNLVQLSTSLGIITDKIQLLKGDPTERIETIPRMVIERIRVNPPTRTEVYTQPAQQ